jgi:hypothetical protein
LKKMVFNFKKIASVASSGLMMSATLALAAAANYPAPFVQNGHADVAIVVGESAASADLSSATALTSDLATTFAAQGGQSQGSTTITGENFPLFTSSTEIYLNDSLNTARTTLDDTNLPMILADSDFSGNVDSDVTQTITLPSTSRVLFGQEPTSDDDPTVFVNLGTSSSNIVYNTTVTFDQAVALNHSDSEGESMVIFGKEWTVGTDTDGTTLVLYQSSERIPLSLGGSSPTPSTTVTVDGMSFTIELLAASDTSATVRVTDSAGNSRTKEIDEDESAKVNGVEVAVAYSDESEATGVVSAEIIVGSNKITLKNGENVKVGSDEESLDGTSVNFNGGTTAAMTSFTVSVFSDDSDEDALVAGGSFHDPVWGTFDLRFTEISDDLDNTDRDMITVESAGDDRVKISMTDHQENEASFEWVNNETQSMRLAYGDQAKEVIRVWERAPLNRSMYVVVGNQDEGYLLKLDTVTNSSSDTDDDIIFKNVFDTSQTYKASITSEGSGSVTIGGRTYAVSYNGVSTNSDNIVVRLNYPDSSTSTQLVVYPTIETSKGAKVSFYEPLIGFNVSANGIQHGISSSLTGFIFPDGDDYASAATLTLNTDGTVTLGGSGTGTANVTSGTSGTVTVGRLTYNVTQTGRTLVDLRLIDPVSGGNIVNPALVMWEEEEDRTDNEEAMVLTLTGAGTSDVETEVNTVKSTATTPSSISNTGNSFISLESNDDMSQILTLYGTLVTLDAPSSGTKKATISYPDDQVQAMLYVAETDATTSNGGGALGNIVVTDNQVSTVGSKNLVVVGGSCINKVASRLLSGADSAICGADFTARTGVGTGSYLIQSFASPWSSSKVAVLVAGYTAEDTTNAATALRTQKPDTMAGKKYTGSTATTLTPVTA